MSDHSAIEWTDASWNPVRGCTKISPGCTHCYAETFSERFRGVPGHPYEHGFDLRLVPNKLPEPLRWQKSRMVFVNSMSDLFHQDVPTDYIARVARVMLMANWHAFQVLTKRADRLRDLLAGPLLTAAQQPHIWWGVSVENRRYGLPRVEALRASPAAVRFLSIEPLLEDLGSIDLSGIHWVIVGGESGPGARPMRPEWVDSIREQCVSAGIPFFFKQWGGVQKKKAGRLLNGRIFDELPPRRLASVPDQARRLALVAKARQLAAIWKDSRQDLGSLVGQELSPEGSDQRFSPATPRKKKAARNVVEEFDRIMALRMIVTYRNIDAESLETYCRQWDRDDFREDPASVPDELLDEFEQLIAGEAVIRLPNGERWVYLYALGLSSAFPEAGSDNTFITHLYRLLVEHKVLREHLGPGLPAVLLNAATLDPTRTFCEDCMRWVDLHADAAQS